MVIDIEIPDGIKISANKIYSGVHFSVRAQDKNIYRWIVAKAIKNNPNIRQINPALYPVSVNYLFKLTGRQMDVSNLSYMVKLIEDSLVHSKIIVDDSPQYVRSISISSKKSTDKKNLVIVSIV